MTDMPANVVLCLSLALLVACTLLFLVTTLFLWNSRDRARASSLLRYDDGLTVCAIFKNEAMVIREFCEHYLWQGAKLILLANNGSTDDWRSPLKGLLGAQVQVVADPRTHQQQQITQDLFSRVQTEWCAIVDMDEFVYARGRHATLLDFLRTTDADKIKIKWKFFTSNGHVKQPPSVRAGFTRLRNTRAGQYKSIFKTAKAAQAKIHDTKMKPGSRTIAFEDNKANGRDALNLNHYAIMSREYFEKVKMKRGDASYVLNDSMRTWEYFARHDEPGDEDDELARLMSG